MRDYSIIRRCNIIKISVENSYLSSQNVFDMKQELEEADKTGSDKKGIYDKYGKISQANKEKAIGAWADLNGGIDVADALKWAALVDDLNSEDRAQLVNFVKAKNAQSAQAIYDSLSIAAILPDGSKRLSTVEAGAFK